MNDVVAILDDEADIVELVSLHLKKNGFKTKEFFNAKTLLKFLETEIPQLLVLDLMLPDLDGIEVCKFIKSNNRLKNIPIIMLTAKQDETDKIVGLELGADDYVTKPFSPKELVARVKVVLRRGVKDYDEKLLEIENILKIDLQRFEVFTANNKKIELTTTEFKILQTLVQKRGWVFSREKLLDSLWGDEKVVLDRTIDVHIKNLREKLGSAGEYIKNIRGVGYKFE
jgi:DNA-binding response OmpR family regulator